MPGAEGALFFQAGGARVAARLARADGALQGVDLDVPYGAPEEDFHAAVLLASTLAVKLELLVMDPQLGGELTPARAEAAVATWRSSSKYAMDTLGAAEDARRSAPIEALPPMVGTRSKVMLSVIGLVVAAYLLLSWLVGELITTVDKPID